MPISGMMEVPPFLLFVRGQDHLKTASYLGISQMLCRHCPEIQLARSEGAEALATICAHGCWVLSHCFGK